MGRKIDIWLVGNTGLRNPLRIQEGLKMYAQSPFVGNLHGSANEIGFMNYLNAQGVIHNETGNDVSGSHARKWRLMFAKNGFIYPQVKKNFGFLQEELGPLDEITPFGRTFLNASTFPAVQECFLRSMSVEQFPLSNGDGLFSPLRWILAIMLELERRTGTSELSRIEFALWGHATDPSYDIKKVVDCILDLRERRKKAASKRKFDKQEIAERGKDYPKKKENFLDYSDMNMRYLRITGVLQRKGRGLIIVPAKHVVAEKLAKSTATDVPLKQQWQMLCTEAPLPTDDLETAKSVLIDMKKQLDQLHILYDISNLPLTTSAEVNNACRYLEEILFQTNEIAYAEEQRNKWQEISDYMTLLINGGGVKAYDEDNQIEVPKDEKPVYLEWTIWRAALAIDSMTNKPYESRGFRLDSDFMPVSTAGGGKGDLYCEFKDYTILIEVTTSTNSMQEAMEGEPVRRHVSDAVLKYDKPVYGMFVAIKVDTNTAETFRHGVWYAKDDERQRLNIVPFSLRQFQLVFDRMFQSGEVSPQKLVDLMNECESYRDSLNAPEWKDKIDQLVSETVES